MRKASPKLLAAEQLSDDSDKTEEDDSSESEGEDASGGERSESEDDGSGGE